MFELTNEDVLDVLDITRAGVWKLEAEAGKDIRFYGNHNMNVILGVPDDISPEERYKIFWTRIHKDDMGLFLNYYNNLKNDERAEVIYRYLHPELGTIYVRCAGKKVEKGIVTKYIGFHQDITEATRFEREEKEQLSEKAEQYQKMALILMEKFSGSTIALNLKEDSYVILTSEDKSMSKDNGSYSSMCESLSLLVPETYRDKFIEDTKIEKIRDNLLIKDKYTFSTFLNNEDGSCKRVSYWYYAMDNECKMVLSFYMDTTEDYKREEELAKALYQAEKASRTKTIFLNNMSHDMRTPMNAILGFTGLAKKHLGDEDKCADYLSKIETSSKHLLNLINDVLDMSRIESGKIKLSPADCSLTETLNELKTILQANADEKRLHFILETESLQNENVICDKLRLNQVLLNCASNSIKFTPEGGSVKITASWIPGAPEGYGDYSITVEDTGIGMKPEFLKTIFEPFSREESGTVSKIQGTGLGMTIAKNIVDMMDGTIRVESRVGVGTKFTINFRFPLSSIEIESKEKDNSEKTFHNFEGKNILLVEDNELNREIALEILEETGANIEVAEDGSIAVKKVSESEENYYDLILMDVQMPIMNGYDATRRIRGLNRKDVHSVIIVAMTANAFEEDRQNALMAGMNGHIAKPVDVPLLMLTMESILNSKRR